MKDKITIFIVRKKINGESGAVAVIVAILLIVLLGLTALAVDVGYMTVAKNESQNAADAAALAGARRMGENYYLALDPIQDVVNVAQNTAHQNKVAELNLAETAGDNVITKIGIWDPTANPKFNETSVKPRAVQTEVRRQGGTPNGPINTFFANVLGVFNYNMKATAVASLSGFCEQKPSIPLAIGKSWFNNDSANHGCKQIAVNDTMSSCAGWTNLSTDSYQQHQVQDLLTNPTTIPMVTAGSSVGVGNGTVSPILTDLKTLFDNKTYDSANKTFDSSGNVTSWTTTVVVIDDGNQCGAYNNSAMYTVIGFATVRIDSIITTGSDKGISGVIQCDIVKPGRGGCFYAGTYGKIPNLVQ